MAQAGIKNKKTDNEKADEVAAVTEESGKKAKAPAKKAAAKKKAKPAAAAAAKKAKAAAAAVKKPAAAAAKKAKPVAKKPAAPAETETQAKKTAPKKKASKKKAPAKGAAAKQTAGAAVVKKGTALVVVESPAKAKTIKKYLGEGFTVQASVGHVKDLPKSKIGVDFENDFAPQYEIIRGKAKIIADIKKAAKSVDMVYLAPDPDREGEAIAWHIAEEIRSSNPNIKRVLFNEITKRAVTEALAHPIELDARKFDSQQSRRILDRLVGYQISPILWTKVRRGLSAGRVQSVAVRIVIEREGEITAFNAEEYWTVEADVEAQAPPPFRVRLIKVDGQKPGLTSGALAHPIANELRTIPLLVSKVEKKERRKNPPAPFITSKLQQEAAHKLRFTAKRTMGVAQRLYEGVELGEEGPVGLITYMRTDSTRMSDDAVREVREHIVERYGKEFLPDEPMVYKSKKSGVQDAHEAIRPTSTKYDPETVRRLLSEEAKKQPDKARDIADQIKLYQLIWNRFVACQMKPAVYDQTTVEVAAGRYELRASGQVLKAAGFTAVYNESRDDDPPKEGEAEAEGEDRTLPPVVEGEVLKLLMVHPDQHFTQPPPRFTEASLVKELEEKGIGRPSTYASILSTIQDRGYVEKKEGRFFPTLLGTRVNELLVHSFPDILNVDFTAQMEGELDQIEEGVGEMSGLLNRFYTPFKADLLKAQVEMKDWKREETPTEHLCEKCGKPMVIKWGRNGEFLACSGYPECKNTKEFIRTDDGKIEMKPEATTDEICEVCKAPMVVKRGRFGEFLACSRYPECKTTKPISLGMTCPKPGCGGFLTEKRSKRGKPFYGCSNYSKTQCDFVSWDRPVKDPCPECGATFLLKKVGRRGAKLRCANPECTYVLDMTAEDAPEAGDTEDAEPEEGAA